MFSSASLSDEVIWHRDRERKKEKREREKKEADRWETWDWEVTKELWETRKADGVLAKNHWSVRQQMFGPV